MGMVVRILTIALSVAINLGKRVKIRRYHHIQGSRDDDGRPGTQADGLEENIPRTDADGGHLIFSKADGGGQWKLRN